MGLAGGGVGLRARAHWIRGARGGFDEDWALVLLGAAVLAPAGPRIAGVIAGIGA